MIKRKTTREMGCRHQTILDREHKRRRIRFVEFQHQIVVLVLGSSACSNDKLLLPNGIICKKNHISLRIFIPQFVLSTLNVVKGRSHKCSD